MTDWKEFRLGDIFDIINGYAFKSCDFVNNGVPVIKIKNVKPNVINFNDLSFVSTDFIKVKASYLIRPTDILITMSGNRIDGSSDSWVGKVSLFKHKGDYFLNQRVSVLRLKNDVNFDITFLSYLLSSWDAQLYFIKHANSSGGQANISPSIISNYFFSLPPLAEQRRIAGILSALDEKIETNRRINARLEELAQAIFKSWFIDFAPFGGTMPEDWTFKCVADFPREIGTGKRPKGGVSSITQGVPSIGAESIKGIGYYDYSKTKYIPFEYADSMKKGLIQDFDLLIYKDGGKPGYFIPNFSMMGLGFPFEKMFLNEHVFRLNFGTPELNIFAYFFFKTDEVMNYLNSVGGKAAIPGINKKNVEDIEILDLNIPQIKQFGAIVLPMFKTILKNSTESARLATLRDTLLPKLMFGKIKP